MEKTLQNLRDEAAIKDVQIREARQDGPSYAR